MSSTTETATGTSAVPALGGRIPGGKRLCIPGTFLSVAQVLFFFLLVEYLLRGQRPSFHKLMTYAFAGTPSHAISMACGVCSNCRRHIRLFNAAAVEMRIKSTVQFPFRIRISHTQNQAPRHRHPPDIHQICMSLHPYTSNAHRLTLAVTRC